MTTRSRPLTRPTAFVPFRTPVRGHAFAPRPPQAHELAPGRPVVLRREPANPADHYAVAVWSTAAGTPWRIGYLAREVAARLAPRLDEGAQVEARLDGWLHEPTGRWQRPVLAVFPTPSRYGPGSPMGSPPTAPAADTGGVVPARPARSVRRRVRRAPDR